MERRQKKGVIGLAGRRKRRMVAEIDGRGCLSLHPCNNNPAGSKETGSKLINLPEWYFDETKSKQFALWNRMNQVCCLSLRYGLLPCIRRLQWIFFAVM